MQYEVVVQGRLRQVSVHRVDGKFVVALDGQEWTIDAARVDARTLSLLIRGRSHEVSIAADPGSGLTVRVGGTPVTASFNARRRGPAEATTEAGSGPQRLAAPMPGKIVRVLVKTGEAVTARQPLVVIEAMKMENELRAAADGTVAEIHVQDGQSVDAGTLLAVIHR